VNIQILVTATGVYAMLIGCELSRITCVLLSGFLCHELLEIVCTADDNQRMFPICFSQMQID